MNVAAGSSKTFLYVYHTTLHYTPESNNIEISSD